MNQQYFYRKIVIGLLLAVGLAACKIPYTPKLKSSETNALVVEGFIDGAAPVSFKLSRVRALTAGDTASAINELNARVLIEDDHQNVFPLNEAGNGIYRNTVILNLNASYQYRLHIFTSNSEEYLSALVPFRLSPPIDTIGWMLQNNGVQVLLSTHDPNNTTRYYRWAYSETWQFNMPYYSAYAYNPANNSVVPRTNSIYTCWQSDNSNSIFLGSSANLSNDVITQMPLGYLAQHDPKISLLYSVAVTQYALDTTAYNYWLAMKNNTENVGSIFDPQPNETPGNIHCITNPAELVVGYVSAGNSFTKRLFINHDSLPLGWNLPSTCNSIMVPDNPDSIQYYFGGYYDPIDQISLPFGGIEYSASTKPCVDCTLFGTNIKPAYWP